MSSDFGDIAAGFRKQREAQAEQVEDKPMDFGENYRLRGKMVGVLVRDARQAARRSIEDCARFLQVHPQEIEAWEFGDRVPSLPQLELLAYYIEVPISHFWTTETFQSQQNGSAVHAQDEYLALRTRMVGVLLRQAREEAGLSLEALAEMSGLQAGQINQYELGEVALPMHELEVLASGVRKNMSFFLDSSSYIGELLAQRSAWKDFSDMPPEVRAFVSNPLNAGFLNIAIMFSKMPAAELRKVGESILDITM